jgi:Bacteriocin-protection, YdeI or OmpD-Associated/Domain of unknown function (DUF1905)
MRLRTVLEPRGPAAAVILTEAQVAELGGAAKTPPVRVTVNGHTFRGRVARMGGESMIGFSRAVREAAGVEPGQELDFEIVLDDAPREVEVPPALAAAFEGDPAAKAAFDGLAFTHRKEFARWIEEAKRDETRDRRVAQALEMLREGRTRS